MTEEAKTAEQEAPVEGKVPVVEKGETSDLPVLLSQQGHLLLIPKLNKQVKLHALTLGDICELETDYQLSFGEIFPPGGRIPVERILRVIWMSARKEGKTFEQIKSGEHTYQFNEVKNWFDLGDLAALGPVMEDILQLSGFKAEAIAAAKKEVAGQVPG